MLSIEIATSRIGRRNGIDIKPDLAQLLRDAMPAFVTQLVPQLKAGDIWFVVENSAQQLTQMLIPKAELLVLLEGDALRDVSVMTRKGLREIALDTQQIFFVAVTKGDDGKPMRIGQGRINLSRLDPAA